MPISVYVKSMFSDAGVTTTQAAAAVHKDSSARTAVIPAVTARENHRQCMLRRQEGCNFLP